MRAGAQLLMLPDRPTAIFATNDDMAAGLVAAAAQRGIAIPVDVSIVGFDDSWIATSVWPHLTTIHQPIEGYLPWVGYDELWLLPSDPALSPIEVAGGLFERAHFPFANAQARSAGLDTAHRGLSDLARRSI